MGTKTSQEKPQVGASDATDHLRPGNVKFYAQLLK